MTHFCPEAQRSNSNQARAFFCPGDYVPLSDWLSLLLSILMHSPAIDHQSGATGDHGTSYHTANRQLAGREDMLKRPYRRLNTGPQRIVGRAHPLAQQGNLNPPRVHEQGGRLAFVRLHPTLLLVEGAFRTSFPVKPSQQPVALTASFQLGSLTLRTNDPPWTVIIVQQPGVFLPAPSVRHRLPPRMRVGNICTPWS